MLFEGVSKGLRDWHGMHQGLEFQKISNEFCYSNYSIQDRILHWDKFSSTQAGIFASNLFE